MIRLPRRASVLLALSLLTAAATAHAECAWVLWDVQSNISSNTAPPLDRCRSVRLAKSL
jgi:hypothetical protein